MSIQRFDTYTCGIYPYPLGELVYYADHLIEVEALQAKIKRLESLLEHDLDDCK